MPADIFIDTNILVYAHDLDAGHKHNIAKRFVAELWQQPNWPGVSVQVLQELYVNLYRKGIPTLEARETVQDYAAWHVVESSVSLLEEGMDETERWRLSLWDGLIVAAARRIAASVIYSEDLSDTQDYAGIRIVNPFV